MLAAAMPAAALLWGVEFTRAGWALLLTALLCFFPYFCGNFNHARCAQALFPRQKDWNFLRREVEACRREKHTPQVYLGRGYVFTPSHTRRLFDLLDQGLTPGADGQSGSPDIHGLEENNNQLLSFPEKDLSGHTMIFGTTGSGKTRFLDLLVSQAVLRGDTVIIIDPKGDTGLMHKTRQACRMCDRQDQFRLLDTAAASASVKFNPLGTFTKISEVGDRIASLMPSGGSASSFRQYANSAVTAATAVLRLAGKNVTLRNLREVLTDYSSLYAALFNYLRNFTDQSGCQEAMEYFARICSSCSAVRKGSEREDGHKNSRPSLELLKSYYAWLCSRQLLQRDPDLDFVFSQAGFDKAYYLKISAGALPVLNSLCTGDLADLLSPAGWLHTFDTFINANAVFYVALNCLIDATSGGNLGKLLLADLSALAGARYASGFTGGHRISVFVDEASEVAGESLIQLLNKSRGAGFAVTLATQTYADLVSRSGSVYTAAQIIGNCNTLISLRIKDAQSAETVSSRLMQTSATVRSTVLAGSPGKEEQLSAALSQRACPLFPAQALYQLPDLEYVALLSGALFVKGCIPFLEGEG